MYNVFRQNLNVNVVLICLLVLVVVLLFVAQDASRTTTEFVDEESSQEECFRGHVELAGRYNSCKTAPV